MKRGNFPRNNSSETVSAALVSTWIERLTGETMRNYLILQRGPDNSFVKVEPDRRVILQTDPAVAQAIEILRSHPSIETLVVRTEPGTGFGTIWLVQIDLPTKSHMCLTIQEPVDRDALLKDAMEKTYGSS
jgi:hypothetical protein